MTAFVAEFPSPMPRWPDRELNLGEEVRHQDTQARRYPGTLGTWASVAGISRCVHLPQACGCGVPVLTVTRIAFAGDRPVEVNDMVMAGDAYQLVYAWPAE